MGCEERTGDEAIKPFKRDACRDWQIHLCEPNDAPWSCHTEALLENMRPESAWNNGCHEAQIDHIEGVVRESERLQWVHMQKAHIAHSFYVGLDTRLIN